MLWAVRPSTVATTPTFCIVEGERSRLLSCSGHQTRTCIQHRTHVPISRPEKRSDPRYPFRIFDSALFRKSDLFADALWIHLQSLLLHRPPPHYSPQRVTDFEDHHHTGLPVRVLLLLTRYHDHSFVLSGLFPLREDTNSSVPLLLLERNFSIYMNSSTKHHAPETTPAPLPTVVSQYRDH